MLTSCGIHNNKDCHLNMVFHSFFLQVKHYHVTYVDDDVKLLKINCQNFNLYVIFSFKSGELLYTNLLHVGMATIRL